MPGFKRIISTLGGLRKEAVDDDLPKVRKQSVLKRSNAILRRRKTNSMVIDNVSVYEGQHDQPPNLPANVQDDENFPDEYRERVRGVREFDNEILAVAQLRASRKKSHVPERQRSMVDIFDGLLHGDHRKAQARHSVPTSAAAGALAGCGSPKCRHPLQAIREEGAVDANHRSSSAAFMMAPPIDHPAFDVPRPIPDDDEDEQSFRKFPVLPPIDYVPAPLRIRRNFAHERREAWVHQKKTGEPIAKRASQRVERARDGPGQQPFANSSVEEMAFARLQQLAGDIRAMEAQKRKVRTDSGNAGQGVTEQQRDCIVCGDSKSTLDFPAKAPSAACEHTPQTCSDCLESWMASEVDTKGSEGIKCPECPRILTYTDIQRAASPSTFATYDNLTIRAVLGNLKDFAWCLSPTCGFGQENHANANYMDCHACGYKQCLSHRMPWHTGETCSEYDYRTSGQKRRDEERQTEQMLDTVSKKCPNPTGCGWRIQKVSGCDHMTCRRCRFEFCWICCASQKEIRRVGNTAHKDTCQYHSKNLEVAWPFNAH